MKTQISFFSAMLVLAACFAAAQKPTAIRADIPFSFTVEGKTLPAGLYQFKEGTAANTIRVTNTKTKEAAFTNVISRLGSKSKIEIVFDVVGNDHILSEIYMPGGDGYLIKATPGQHTHALVKAEE